MSILQTRLIYNNLNKVAILLVIIISSHFLFSQSNLIAQPLDDIQTNTRGVIIEDIFLAGNKKTEDKIILRELFITKGREYNYDSLKKLIPSERNKIYNTNLFNEVEVTILELSYNKVNIIIRVVERWYLIPLLLIDIIDRNFNDWWINHNHELNRISYGLSLYHYNMRGMNEKMTITAQFGFIKKIEFNYLIPFIDKRQRHGLSFVGKYFEYRNLHYKTVENKRVFIESEELLKTTSVAEISYRLRNSFYTHHGFRLSYKQSQISDTIIELNSDYLGAGKNNQRYISVGYDFTLDKRDINAYPLQGYKFSFDLQHINSVTKSNISKTSLYTSYSHYFELKNRFYLNNMTSISVSMPSSQPYSLLTGLGFRDNLVRGYELYSIYAKNYFLNKAELKKMLFRGSTQWKRMPLEQFQYIPYGLYIKLFFDIGYAEDIPNLEGNAMLADKWLVGTGIGLDFITMYDLIIKAKYSINNNKESGFFISLVSEF